jgi:hypothetical protein
MAELPCPEAQCQPGVDRLNHVDACGGGQGNRRERMKDVGGRRRPQTACQRRYVTVDGLPQAAVADFAGQDETRMPAADERPRSQVSKPFHKTRSTKPFVAHACVAGGRPVDDPGHLRRELLEDHVVAYQNSGDADLLLERQQPRPRRTGV